MYLLDQVSYFLGHDQSFQHHINDGCLAPKSFFSSKTDRFIITHEVDVMILKNLLGIPSNANKVLIALLNSWMQKRSSDCFTCQLRLMTHIYQLSVHHQR
jgi:hypothetical protein